MASELRLHYAPRACSLASHIALEEAGLVYEAQAVNLSVPDQRAALLEINPKGAVPTLEADGRVLTENVAILCHIARLAPAADIAPEDPFEFAQALSLLAWCASTVHVAFRQMLRPARYANDPAAHDAVRTVGRETAWAALEAMDARLASQAYMLGDRYSIADGYPVVFCDWAGLLQLPIAELKHLTAFRERMIARPAVSKVLERERAAL